MQAKSRPTKPDDSPLRDGNRDRLVGLLTQRACKTLLFYCSETNQHMYHWLNAFVEQNPIPREGKVEDISGTYRSFVRWLVHTHTHTLSLSLSFFLRVAG